MRRTDNRKNSKYTSLSRNAVEQKIKRANWDDITPRLLLRASQLHLKYLSNVQAAPEPEDLVQDAIADLMSGQRTWPSELPLNVVLYGIIRSRVSNFLKKHRALGLEDPGQLLDPAVAAEIPLDLLKGEIKNLVQDDSELKRIIDYMLEDPLLNPRDLANLMECPVARIYNAKKRLERKLSIFRKGLR